MDINTHSINDVLKNRILVLDGATGTMIQKYKLEEDDYRGDRFKDFHKLIKGNNDILCLTQPAIVKEIHEKYLLAGADIIETNTFNAQRISLSDYDMEDLAYEINYEASKIAKQCAKQYSTGRKPRFVAGSIGPTNKTASMSSDVNDPSFRSVTFNVLVEAYSEQVRGLIDGGCDVLLIETVFDTLNAKICLFAIENVFKEKDISLPVMISVTIADASGRTLSGQKLSAFLCSVSHFPLLSIGLNCAMGAEQMLPYIEELSDISPFYVSAHPNAGLPNQFGEYDESAQKMSLIIKDFINNGFVNIIGGCCGTTPEHIKLINNIAKKVKPRLKKPINKITQLSGLELLNINKENNFINIGERTNVAGSLKFAKLIREQKYEEALSVARQQIENGAQIIDISFDDSMLDAEKEMQKFLRLISSDPDISRVPIMVDSSKWNVIEIALQNIQGKAIVNSISLKEGEEEFVKRAQLIRKYGGAVIVMAFDEEGQAETFNKKIEVSKRAYDILTKIANFPAEDIVFDCNILTIGTGLEEHNNYAVDFIKSVEWIKNNLPYSKTSGGISNLSFSFRGNNKLREAMHTVFLYHAINAGLDMGIVNAGALPIYDDIEIELRNLCEDLILNRRDDATERMLIYSENVKSTEKEQVKKEVWRENDIEYRLEYSLIKGIFDYIDVDIEEAIGKYPEALQIIEEPLMKSMNKVGDLFSSGKMFLPQVIKSARVMKKAVSILQPIIEKQNMDTDTIKKAGKILLATVKGDVHDIGKNIFGVILACNNYEIIDLGIMVSKDKIIEEAIKQKVDIIGLSGLITPSLDEMIYVAIEMEKRNMKIPLLIGGATTSEIHTAVKIDSVYSGPVIHVRDASRSVSVVSSLLNKKNSAEYSNQIKNLYKNLREAQLEKGKNKQQLTIDEARGKRFIWEKGIAKIIKPNIEGIKVILDFSIEKIVPYINWSLFYREWRLNAKFPNVFNDVNKGEEAKVLYDDAQKMLQEIIDKKILKANAVVGIFKANSIDESIEIYLNNSKEEFKFLRNREKDKTENLCLSDFIAPKKTDVVDYIGMFGVSTGFGIEKLENKFKNEHDDYSIFMLRIIANRLVEAFSELLHKMVRNDIWGYEKTNFLEMEDLFKGKYTGIRPVPGYPSCPEHSDKEKIFRILDIEKNIGIKLTESWSMYPGASVCGFYFAHPGAKHFSVID